MRVSSHNNTQRRRHPFHYSPLLSFSSSSPPLKYPQNKHHLFQSSLFFSHKSLLLVKRKVWTSVLPRIWVHFLSVLKLPVVASTNQAPFHIDCHYNVVSICRTSFDNILVDHQTRKVDDDVQSPMDTTTIFDRDTPV